MTGIDSAIRVVSPPPSLATAFQTSYRLRRNNDQRYRWRGENLCSRFAVLTNAMRLTKQMKVARVMKDYGWTLPENNKKAVAAARNGVSQASQARLTSSILRYNAVLPTVIDADCLLAGEWRTVLPCAGHSRQLHSPACARSAAQNLVRTEGTTCTLQHSRVHDTVQCSPLSRARSVGEQHRLEPEENQSAGAESV